MKFSYMDFEPFRKTSKPVLYCVSESSWVLEGDCSGEFVSLAFCQSSAFRELRVAMSNRPILLRVICAVKNLWIQTVGWVVH